MEGAPTAVEPPAEVTVADTAPTQVRSPRGLRRSPWIWVTAGGVGLAALGLTLTLWLRPFQVPLAPPPAPLAPPAAPPVKATDDQAAKAKAAAEEEARKKAAAEEAARKAAEERKRQEEAETRRPTRAGITQRRGRDNAEMISIPAGTFTMGDTQGDGDSDEKPTHQVTLDAFWLDRTEVTNAQFAQFIQAGNTAQGDWQQSASGKDQHPVVNVTWNDSVAYCRWAGKRLPSEAEWEYAARGTDGRKYPWGNTWEASRARFSGNRGNETTAPVGSYPTGASPFGVLDLAGNVWEWVQDWYGSYPSGSVRNPTGPNRGEWRVDRGGSGRDDPGGLRSASRFGVGPADRGLLLGFRCAQGS